MRNSLGTRESAEKWGYKPSSISEWCRLGLIKGVNQDKKGSSWHIPKNAVCPKPTKKKEGNI